MIFSPYEFHLDCKMSVAHADCFHTNFAPTLIGIFNLVMSHRIITRSVRRILDHIAYKSRCLDNLCLPYLTKHANQICNYTLKPHVLQVKTHTRARTWDFWELSYQCPGSFWP